ncbi:MAG: DUF2002 family protein [Alcanivorax sp.]|uniref:DUF2002 family protein n=1 Tax=Alcanivorax sp. TaxID=1872427 RepID=UPI003C5C08FB
MLKSKELTEELTNAGFSIYNKNQKAHRFTKGKTVVYVKMDTEENPLLVHPDIQDLMDLFGDIAGIERGKNFYHNSSLTKFPKPPTTESQKEPRGLALAVSDRKALKDLLTLLEEYELTPDIKNLGYSATDSTGSTTTERLQQANARIGQGKYRKDLIDLWQGCSVTGAKNPKILKASHMKPWRTSEDEERLNPYNGLLLTANLDAAFDNGLITFSRNGKILIAREFTDAADFGIDANMKLRKLDAQHQEYLTWHRDNEFKG